ncbi:MAG: cyclic nucleotide-binding domain-containing protein [Thermodesulfobacteriota bacterium]
MMKSSFALAGSLDFLNLGELFQLLGANNSTGTLRIISRYKEEPGIVYFQKGNPINATASGLSGLEAIYSLFGWSDGEFEFVREPVDHKVVIKKNRMEITLEGMKMLDEGLISRVGPVSLDKQPRIQLEGDVSPLAIVKGPLVDYMYVADEEDYAAGETIVKQGRHGNWIWVVLDGILEIRKETPGGQVPILRIGIGSFIGSIASFLTQGSVRATTVVAITNVQLGVLDSQRISRENALFSENFKKIVKSLDKRYKQCTNLATDIRQKKRKTDDFLVGKEPLIREGESKDGLFLVEQGNAYVARKTDRGYLPLARIEEGDFIGQMSFLQLGHEPNSAAVFASEDLQLKQLSKEEIQKEYEELSVTMKNLIENTATSISALTKTTCDMYLKIR